MQNMKDYSARGLVKLLSSEEEYMQSNDNCLNMIYNNDANQTAPLISIASSSCTSKMYVACTLDASEDTLPIAPTKFPCITENSNARKKRNVENIESKLRFDRENH